MSKIISGRKVLFSILLSLLVIFSGLFSTDSHAAKRDRTPPTAPVNLKAVSIAANSTALSWDASTDNIGVKSYNIYKNGVLAGSSATTSFTADGLAPATSYAFYVKAKDVAGNISNQSNTITVMTLQAEPAPLPEPAPVPAPVPAAAGRIVGYYAAWSAYTGFTPEKLDALKLTHINYAFANIGTDLKIAMGFPDIDPSNFTKLNALKQLNPDLKTLISVGGWTWSGRFSDAALTDTSRTVFADSCADFITKYGFDGVDIDWEYPVGGGLSSNVTRPEDKQNFTLLLHKLRERLDARGMAEGKHYLLTIAGGAGNLYINNTELGMLYKYLDYGNLMTYDLHGTWDKYTDFNAPLYTNSDISPQYKWSVDSAVNAWLNAGFPADKLVMGVPFYGYKYNAVNNANTGLYQTFTSGSSLSWATIKSTYLGTPGYVRYFHSASMIPWLFNGSVFISYEDEQSVGLKAQYAKSRALGGAMIWELSQDPDGTLLTSLYNGIR